MAGTAAAVALSGCGGGFRVSDLVTRTAPPQEIQSVTVSKRQIVITAPPGWCVDPRSSQTVTDPAFVLFGNCAALGRSAIQPPEHALLTASVAQNDTGTPVALTLPELDTFFRSEAGRAALARDGDPGKVRILESFLHEDTYFIRAEDMSTPVAPGAAAEYWRAYFDIGDQIVSLSVIGFTEDPLRPEKALYLLRRFANQIRVSNGLDPYMIAVPGAGLDEETETADAAAAAPAPAPAATSATATSPYETDDDYVEYDTEPARHAPRRKVNVYRTLQTIGLLRQLFM